VLMVLASAGVLAAFLISRTALSVLGRNWSFVAAVGRDHELVEHGPYASIRHPLYASFFLMTMATAVIWSRPAAIAVSGIIFAVGVWIRIRVEEKLLHEAFGLKFESYCRRVPGVLPIRRGKRV
jgi:protein-S-isoprenylcysteine O-methyltransferase Ste14